MTPAFHEITETPGIGATREQLSMLATRYRLAVEHARGPTLEVACGTGIGLGVLAEVGGAAVGVDIDSRNVAIARETWSGDGRVRIEMGPAERLDFPPESFSCVVCFEALYYFSDLEASMKEMARVLRRDGALVLCSVNPGWSGFNPSPWCTQYPTPATLAPMLTRHGFSVECFGGFPDTPRGFFSRFVSRVRRFAVRLHLIPGSMKGKEWLKKIFLGGVVPMPRRLELNAIDPSPLSPISPEVVNVPFKVFYFVARKKA